MEQGYERLSPEDLKASSSDYAFNRLCGVLFFVLPSRCRSRKSSWTAVMSWWDIRNLQD
jgi:hypothetical protein